MEIPKFKTNLDNAGKWAVKESSLDVDPTYAFDVWLYIVENNLIGKYPEVQSSVERAGFPVKPGVREFINHITKNDKQFNVMKDWMTGNTMVKIAQSHNITQHRVHQILEKVIRIMNQYILIHDNINYDDVYANSIDVLHLSVRAYNCLKRKGIFTLKDVVDQIGDVSHIRNAGPVVQQEVQSKLNEFVKSIKPGEPPVNRDYRNYINDSGYSFDSKNIKLVIRDINGKRTTLEFHNVAEFNNVNWGNFDDVENQILLVIWGSAVVYSQLQNNKPILIEDILGFFA